MLVPLTLAYWVIFHVLSFADFSLRNQVFRIILSSVKQFGSRSGLIWVQTVCKGYQQTTPASKE